MTTGRRPSARTLAFAVVTLGAIGTVASAALAADDAWLTRAISALTIDPASAGLFRATMALVGVGMLVLAIRLRPIIAELRVRRQAGAMAGLIVPGVGLIGLGFLGVAIFPVDGPAWVVIAHGTTAYTPPIVLMLGMLLARPAVPALGDRFGRLSLGLLASILLLYLVAVAGSLPWGLMELLVFIPAGLWLVVFVDRLERLASNVPVGAPEFEPAAAVAPEIA